MDTEKQATQLRFSSFYIIDLVKQLFKTKNITAVIYLFLNLAVIFFAFVAISHDMWGSALTSVIIYSITSFVFLSPIGEWVLRLTQSCRKLKAENSEDKRILNRVEPLFNEVLERACTKNTGLRVDPKICLYVQNNSDMNAFAIGRRTVCMTTGLLECTDEHIKAVLAHEIGHLAAHDTDLMLLITVGNVIIAAGVTILKIAINLVKLFLSAVFMVVGGQEKLFGRIINSVCNFLILLCVNIVMWIWTKLGILMVMHSSRKEEFAADVFSCDLGYTDGLLSFLENLTVYENAANRYSKMSTMERLKKKTEVFTAFSSSHPKATQRIERIKEAMGQ